MRSLFSSNRRIGLLSDEAIEEDRRAEAEEVAAAPAEPAADSLESDLIEIQDTESEGADQEAMVEEAVETHEALEGLVLSLQYSMESGGLSRDAARIANEYGTSLLRRVGMSNVSNVMPGLESFGGVASRANATRLSMESFADKAKALWQRILAQIAKAADWVRELFLKLFAAGDKVLKRAEAMKAALNSFQDGKVEGELDRPQVAKAVSIGGKPNVAGLKVLEEVAKSVNGVWPEITEKGGKAIAEFMAQAAENKAAADLAFPILAPFKNIKNTTSKDLNGFSEIITEELPGGMVLRGKITAKLAAAAQADQEIHLQHGGGAAEADGKMEVLKKEEMVRLVNDVISIAKIMVEYRHAANKFDPIAKSLKDSAKKLSMSKFAQVVEGAKQGWEAGKKGEVTDEQKKEMAEGITNTAAGRNATARLATKSVDLLQGVPAKFYSYSCNTMRAYLDWAQLSMKAHQGDKEGSAAKSKEDKDWADAKKAEAKK